MTDLSIVVLAAGEGTRMKSETPKLLHQVGGASIVSHVLRAALSSGADHLGVVTSPNRPELHDEITRVAPTAQFFEQKEQLGTGHAASMAASLWSEGDGVVIFVYADHPLLQPQTFAMIADKLRAGADAAILGFEPSDPTGYGRLVTNDDKLLRIVEHKDATDDERKIRLCNACALGFRASALREAFPKLNNKNVQGEYYLTDLVQLIVDANGTANYAVETPETVVGVNSRVQLAEAEALFQQRKRADAMEAGVTLRDPSSVYFSHDTRIAADVTIEPNVIFGPGVAVETGVHIKSFSHIEGATIAENATVGPFARLRPGAQISKNGHIGNFTEIKNAVIGEGSKVNHLTYIGDAEVGVGTNIGAGTITCNYDGYNKHKTIIGDRVFVGSNTALVAPVSVGDDALIAAGSTITKNVGSNDLALARAEQINKPSYAERMRARAMSLKKK